MKMAVVLVLMGCVGVSVAEQTNVVSKTRTTLTNAPAGDLVILKATYGQTPYEKDVTDIVKGLVKDNKLLIWRKDFDKIFGLVWVRYKGDYPDLVVSFNYSGEKGVRAAYQCSRTPRYTRWVMMIPIVVSEDPGSPKMDRKFGQFEEGIWDGRAEISSLYSEQDKGHAGGTKDGVKRIGTEGSGLKGSSEFKKSKVKGGLGKGGSINNGGKYGPVSVNTY